MEDVNQYCKNVSLFSSVTDHTKQNTWQLCNSTPMYFSKTREPEAWSHCHSTAGSQTLVKRAGCNGAEHTTDIAIWPSLHVPLMQMLPPKKPGDKITALS